MEDRHLAPLHRGIRAQNAVAAATAGRCGGRGKGRVEVLLGAGVGAEVLVGVRECGRGKLDKVIISHTLIKRLIIAHFKMFSCFLGNFINIPLLLPLLRCVMLYAKKVEWNVMH